MKYDHPPYSHSLKQKNLQGQLFLDLIHPIHNFKAQLHAQLHALKEKVHIQIIKWLFNFHSLL